MASNGTKSTDTAVAAAVYLRISQDRSGEQLGVQRQREACEKLAADRGLFVADVLTDDDISAFSGRHRPGYERLMAGVQSGRYGAVVAFAMDRLHRSTEQMGRYIRVTRDAGVSTFTVTGGEIDLATSGGRIAANVLGVLAAEESEIKRERALSKHAQAAKAGLFRGGTARMYGYQPDALHLDDVEAERVRSAYARVIAGDSLGSIVRDWNAAGYPTPPGVTRKADGTEKRAVAWRISPLRGILLRERNYGASVHLGEVVGRGQWDPIVDEGTWRKARAVLTDPRRRTSSSTKGRHLLSGMLGCQLCGGRPTMLSGTSGRRTVYRCRNGGHLVRVIEPVDEYVTDLVLERLSRPDAADLLRPPVSADDSAQVQTELDGLRARREQLKPLFLEGVLTAADLRTMTADLSGRVAALEVKLTSPERVGVLADLIGAKDPRACWESMSWRKRRQVVDLLMTVTALPRDPHGPRRFDPDSLQITWK